MAEEEEEVEEEGRKEPFEDEGMKAPVENGEEGDAGSCNVEEGVGRVGGGDGGEGGGEEVCRK